MWLTRKGAIRAGAGELGIIPGSMGARSYIVRGRGDAESFYVLRARRRAPDEPHRGEAALLARGSRAADRGRRCAARTRACIDEIPGAYKTIDEVMANQTDLVEVVHTLKQVVCVKG